MKRFNPALHEYEERVMVEHEDREKLARERELRALKNASGIGRGVDCIYCIR